jgi:hypothetical protein
MQSINNERLNAPVLEGPAPSVRSFKKLKYCPILGQADQAKVQLPVAAGRM